MLGTLIKTRPCVRRVVVEESLGARWHRVYRGIHRGTADKGQCNQDNQTSDKY
jgi:hypothetical protein